MSTETRTCPACGEAKALNRYEFKPAHSGRLMATCRDCLNHKRRESYRRKRMAEIAKLPLFVAPTERRCKKCGQTKPLTNEFFARDTNKSGFNYRCHDCRRQEARERYHNDPEPHKTTVAKRYRAIMATKDGRERLRAQSRARAERWRQENPEKARARERRYRERVRADRERTETKRDLARMDYRLRAEKAGHTVERSCHAEGQWSPEVGRAGLDIEPLSVWLEELVAQDVRDLRAIAKVIGKHERVLGRVLRREHQHVSLSVADALVWGYGRPVVVRSEFIKTKLVEWAQSLPGNGTRLLRYLDRAEKVAHLADMTVTRVEDLYPALDEVGA